MALNAVLIVVQGVISMDKIESREGVLKAKFVGAFRAENMDGECIGGW